jgi:hypothetical protein
MGHTPYQGKETDGTGELAQGESRVLLPEGIAGVVLRATVETFGPAGDAELHLSVKWPASALAAAQREPSKTETHGHKSGDNDGYDQEGNIRTVASSPEPR